MTLRRGDIHPHPHPHPCAFPLLDKRMHAEAHAHANLYKGELDTAPKQRPCMHACACACAHACLHTHAHKHTHIHTHTHTHTRARVLLCPAPTKRAQTSFTVPKACNKSTQTLRLCFWPALPCPTCITSPSKDGSSMGHEPAVCIVPKTQRKVMLHADDLQHPNLTDGA
mmetsp:Transcript_27102/g.73252  ORF Transcript_27102/g.73252 Transcript_27102/m.73252 type:complete len:169 (-) Transcript_27102:99-605(-)